MNKRISIAILALLSLISPNSNVQGIVVDQELNEANRYLNSKGEPINLAQSKKHLRLELKKVRKHSTPIPIEKANLLISENCMKTKNTTTSSLSETESVVFDDITHCPINKPGEKVKAHIFQNNLNDNAYVSEMYVGNPPQLIKALFDTGSTNTWVLNDNVELPGGANKERSFIPESSQTFANTP